MFTFLGSAHFLLFLCKEIGVTLTSTLSSLASVGEWMSSSTSRSSSSPPEQKPASRSVVDVLVPGTKIKDFKKDGKKKKLL